MKSLNILIFMIGFSTLSFATEVSNNTIRGKLSVRERILFVNGEMILPKIEGDLSLSIRTNLTYKGGNAVLLMNSSGGTACPAVFRWLLVLPNSISQTPEFGTCSDLPRVLLKSGKLIVRLPSFVESRDTVFVFDGKRLTEDGKDIE
jgi:hypothetical protein